MVKINKRLFVGLVSGLFVMPFMSCGGAATRGAAGGSAAQGRKASANSGKGGKMGALKAVTLEKLTIVESVPLETEAVLDHENIANAAQLWPQLVQQAKKSIDWAMFYASEKEGAALTPVVEGLLAAASKGVQVRIVADASFYKTYPETLDRLAAAGITVHKWDVKSATKGVMHAKYFIVDGQIAYIGSQNFDYRSLEHVYETGLLIENEEVARRLTKLFEQDIQVAENPKLETDKVRCPKAEWLDEVPLQIELTSTPTRWQTEETLCERQEIVNLIGKAKDSIRIQVLHYSPVGRAGRDYFGDFDEALRRAAARGVKVDLLVSDWGTRAPAIDWMKSLSLVPNITVRIISIPEHSSGFIDHARVAHSKYMTIDSRWSWVGSSNWEKNYFTASRNVGAIIKGARFTRQLSDMFQEIWRSEYAEELDVTKDYVPPRTSAN